MHIGLLTACYWPTLNGVTRMVSLYAEGFRRLGHDVTIFTLGRSRPGDLAAGIVRSPGIPLGNSGYHLAAGYSSAARRLLGTVNVVHAHHPIMALEFGRRYGRAPIIFTNHTHYGQYAHTYLGNSKRRLIGPPSRMAAAYLWRRINLADAIIAPSSEVARLLPLVGVKKPIALIPNGIATERFRRPANPITRTALGWDESAIVAVYTGRLAREKNLETLIARFHEATALAGRLHLLLVGDGPRRKALKSLAAPGRTGHRVHFAGEVPPERLPDFLAVADFFVTASLSEVDPLSVIEAQAVGLPILALAAGWTALQGPHSGFWIGQTPGDLARGFAELTLNPALRLELQAESLQAGQHRSIEKTVARTLDLYRNILAEWTNGSQEGRLGRVSG